MQVEVEGDTGKCWWSTSELRFVRRDRKQALQQKWLGSGGREEWRDVPLVEAGK